MYNYYSHVLNIKLYHKFLFDEFDKCKTLKEKKRFKIYYKLSNNVADKTFIPFLKKKFNTDNEFIKELNQLDEEHMILEKELENFLTNKKNNLINIIKKHIQNEKIILFPKLLLKKYTKKETIEIIDSIIKENYNIKIVLKYFSNQLN